jgi:hypothetical protein
MTVVVARRRARPAPTPGEKTAMRSVAAARRSLIDASRVKSRIACSFLGVPGQPRGRADDHAKAFPGSAVDQLAEEVQAVVVGAARGDRGVSM